MIPSLPLPPSSHTHTHTQSLGLLVSAVIMDLQKAMVMSVVMLLSFMLVGGFYVKRLPSWLQWFQYLSYITYSFDSMLHLEFTPDQQFKYAVPT